MYARIGWYAVLDDVERARRFLHGLGRSGSGARETAKQALKAGLAAAVAWVLAVYVLHLPLPYVAPWTAMIMVRTTVYWSVLSAGRQVAAVVLGVVMAYLAGAALPTTELALAVLVPVAFLMSRWDRLGDQGIYVPFTALFMVTIGNLGGAYVLSRLGEAALGVAVGTAVNLLIFPPVRVRTVGDADMSAGGDIGQLLRDMAAGIRDEWDADDTSDWVDRADRLDDRIWDVRQKLRRGRESLRLNPRRPLGRYKRAVDRYRAATDLMGRSTDAIQSIADSLDQVSHDDTPYRKLDPEFSEQYAKVLDAAADALDERLDRLVSDDPDAPDDDPATAVPSKALDVLEGNINPRLAESSAAIELKGALLVAARRLLRELSV
ncbi:FUSC family protein [Glycomyces arizonensis]|uniref:FUSC family protein n=1 Tax=Glycomyces arizonensis TaxID=256035 RepID=UPI0004275126|nr:FUSC family protein [Glycomyces arizonensis]